MRGFIFWTTFGAYRPWAFRVSSRMNVCVFVSGFSSHLDNFHSNGDFTNTGEGLHILTNASHLWRHLHVPWHGRPFTTTISEEQWLSRLLPSVRQCSCHYTFFFTHVCCGWYSSTPHSACGLNAQTDSTTDIALKSKMKVNIYLWCFLVFSVADTIRCAYRFGPVSVGYRFPPCRRSYIYH